MGEEGKTQMITVQIVFEATDGNDEGLRTYVLNSAKGCCRYARNARIISSVYDEKDEFIGRDVVGSPSEEMRRTLASNEHDEVA